MSVPDRVVLEDDAFIQVEKALKPIYKQAASLVKRKGRASSAGGECVS